MDCPTCLKPYPDNATECSYCALASNPSSESLTNDCFDDDLNGWSDSAPGAGNEESEPDGWAESLENSWDSFTIQVNQAKPSTNVGASGGEGGYKRAFKLPSQADLSSSRALPEADESHAAWSSLLARVESRAPKEEADDLPDDSSDAPPKKKISLNPDTPAKPKEQTWVSPWSPPTSAESQSKVFGRSAEIQEAPLHDSWSSHCEDSATAPKEGVRGGLASAQKDPSRDGWSSGGSHQVERPPDGTWAAAMKAAAREEAGYDPFVQDPVQGVEMPRPMSVEDIPKEEPAAPDEGLETPQPPLKPRKRKGGGIFSHLLTVLFVLLALGAVVPASYRYFTNKVAVPSDSSTSDLDSPLLDDASIWLASAQESLESKDFKLAVAQLERAVSFLKEGEQKRLKETQVLLAKIYSKAGDHRASATLWTELAKSHPKLRKKGKAAAAFRESRIIANKKVKAGEKAVLNKKFDDAIKGANEALELYTVSQGQNSQMARAHGILGDAYRGKQNTRVAFSHFAEASKLDPEGRYKSELRKIRLPVRRSSRPKLRRPVKKAKPKFVITTGVPQSRAKR